MTQTFHLDIVQQTDRTFSEMIFGIPQARRTFTNGEPFIGPHLIEQVALMPVTRTPQVTAEPSIVEGRSETLKQTCPNTVPAAPVRIVPVFPVLGNDLRSANPRFSPLTSLRNVGRAKLLRSCVQIEIFSQQAAAGFSPPHKCAVGFTQAERGKPGMANTAPQLGVRVGLWKIPLRCRSLPVFRTEH